MRQVKVRVTDAVWEALNRRAARSGVPIAVYARVVLAEHVGPSAEGPTGDGDQTGGCSRGTLYGPSAEGLSGDLWGGKGGGVVAVDTGDTEMLSRRDNGGTPSIGGGKREEESSPAEKSAADFARFWSAYPRREGANPKAAARQKWVSRVKAGVDPGELIAGAARYAAYCRATGKLGTEYVKQAQFWLSPSYEGWLQPWAVEKDEWSPDSLRARAAKMREESDAVDEA